MAAAPWVIHEDADLLAVDKPAGVSTHRSEPLGQQGFYELVAGRQPDGDSVSLLHRLDKETSGLLLLGKTARANKALTAAFGERRVEKRYLLLAVRPATAPGRITCQDEIRKPKRRGAPAREADAETDFVRLERSGPFELLEARPRTGRTHQVRVHAARSGFPIVGDGTYGGRAGARLFLHAAGVKLPAIGAPGAGELALEAPLPASFRRVLDGAEPHAPAIAALAAHEARARLFDPAVTSAWLWIDRHHDGFPDLRVERLGRVALALRYDDDPRPLAAEVVDALLAPLPGTPGLEAVWEQRRPRGGQAPQAMRLAGGGEPRFEVVEQGLRFGLDLLASTTSTGLFLDQRETRRALLARDLRGRTVLNAFAHTGALSVAAAKAGATTTSLDLSKRYLEWARENLARNGLDPAGHDFIYGDALDWLRRLEKKGRRFDVALVDPPSFSTSGKKTWSVERDLATLVDLSARLVAPGGSLYVSVNTRRLPALAFQDAVRAGLEAARRRGRVEPTSLPLDHRSGAGDPPYLKGAWVALD